MLTWSNLPLSLSPDTFSQSATKFSRCLISLRELYLIYSRQPSEQFNHGPGWNFFNIYQFQFSIQLSFFIWFNPSTKVCNRPHFFISLFCIFTMPRVRTHMELKFWRYYMDIINILTVVMDILYFDEFHVTLWSSDNVVPCNICLWKFFYHDLSFMTW